MCANCATVLPIVDFFRPSCLNERMIGIFDSGSGGLSVLNAIRARAPLSDIVYFGDLLHSPYGEKSAQELATLVEEGVRVLQENGATEIVSACNSVSHSMLSGAAGHERTIEMSRPTARMMRSFAGERVLLLATPATIASGLYHHALWPIVKLDELAIPLLARAIEEENSRDDIAKIIRSALQSRSGALYDKVLLGCTHYPLVLESIEEEVHALFPKARVIDPADAVAEEVVRQFTTNGSGKTIFMISKDSHGFRNRIAPMFLEQACTLTII